MVGLARRGGGTITVRVLMVRDNSIPRTTGEGSNLVDRTSCGVSAGNGCGPVVVVVNRKRHLPGDPGP